MGWASGSRLMTDVIAVIQARADRLPDLVRQAMYAELITAFERRDCDTLEECREIDPAYDAALDATSEEESGVPLDK